MPGPAPAAARSHRAASVELARLDPVMADLVAQHGPCRIAPKPRVDDRYMDLASSIVYQQLAGKAAATIWGRVRALTPDGFTPEAVLALSDEELRGAGLSGNKMASVRDLSDRVLRGEVELGRMGRLPDDVVVEQLVKVRGIGPWTAHMFLIFALHRMDVWPIGDYGVRAGYAKAFGHAELPTPVELDALGDAFRPYRSVAAWYCWRAADTKTPSAD